jgi:ketosteroid isomerase-like protein
MSTTTADGALATVRRYSDLMQAGDLEAATRLLDDDFVFREPRQLPYGGDHHGPGAVAAVFGQMLELAEVEIVGPIRFHETAGPVVLRLTAAFTSRASGRRVEVDVVELYHVRDGRIVEGDVYYKDPGAVAATLANSS